MFSTLFIFLTVCFTESMDRFVAVSTPQYHFLPGGGSSDLVVVILSQNLEQLVEEHWQESDDYWDSLHAEETLEEGGKRSVGGSGGGGGGEVGEREGWKKYIYIKNINHTEAENKMMFGILVH